jgi:hypothetical protein
MIKPKDYYANPWRDHARQNGIQRGRQGWSDLQEQDDPLRVARGLGNALVLGAALWAVVALVVMLMLGWLE